MASSAVRGKRVTTRNDGRLGKVSPHIALNRGRSQTCQYRAASMSALKWPAHCKAPGSTFKEQRSCQPPFKICLALRSGVSTLKQVRQRCFYHGYKTSTARTKPITSATRP